MKLNKFIIPACVVMMAAMTSCGDDGYWQEYDPKAETYTFSTDEVAIECKPAEIPSQIAVSVMRSAKAGEETIELVAVGSEYLVAPESITFADGETSAMFVVTVANNIPIGATQQLEISLPEECMVDSWGNASTVIALTVDYNWIEYGVGEYTSGLFEESWPQPIYQAVENPSMFKLVDLIVNGYDITIQFVDENTVIMNPRAQSTGFDDDGDILYLYDLRAGANVEDGVISFPVYWCGLTETGGLQPFYQTTETLALPGAGSGEESEEPGEEPGELQD